jgi:hypothetical protein
MQNSNGAKRALQGDNGLHWSMESQSSAGAQKMQSVGVGASYRAAPSIQMSVSEMQEIQERLAG